MATSDLNRSIEFLVMYKTQGNRDLMLYELSVLLETLELSFTIISFFGVKVIFWMLTKFFVLQVKTTASLKILEQISSKNILNIKFN